MSKTDSSVSYFLTEDSIVDEDDIGLPLLESCTTYLVEKLQPELKTQVGLKVCDDKVMASLHDEFMNDPQTTDVMAFNSDEEGYLGDIIVCRDVACREAKERGHDIRAELQFYVLHGFLHLIGYEDGSEAGKATMLNLQSEALLQFGIDMK